MAFHVVFPAAGVGRRFGSDIPKQYCQVRNKTIMEWTLRAFQPINGIERYLISVQHDDELANRLLQNFPNIEKVDGGQERSQSVFNALKQLSLSVSLDDWVLVHDIARPCIEASSIETLMNQCLLQQEGGVLARPVTDTVKQLKADGLVSTVDRSTLWTVQTPQCFQLGKLINALEFCQRQNIAVTDEASAMEAMGETVQLVEGSSRNIKLTHASDLPLIEFYLTEKGV